MYSVTRGEVKGEQSRFVFGEVEKKQRAPEDRVGKEGEGSESVHVGKGCAGKKHK